MNIHRLTERREFEQVRRKLAYLAWRKYRISAENAEDIVQTAVTTYYEVKSRYEGEENQYAILVGIFYKKCLEHIDASQRENRKIKKFRAKPEVQKENPFLQPERDREQKSVLGDLIGREDGSLILSALAGLKPESQELFRLMLEEDYDRKDMIRHFGVNKNTYDTRLRAARLELRASLEQKGVLP
ncbi:MAG: hypothetical protein ABFS86_14265 [Planctomycetota bacterium]